MAPPRVDNNSDASLLTGRMDGLDGHTAISRNPMLRSGIGLAWLPYAFLFRLYTHKAALPARQARPVRSSTLLAFSAASSFVAGQSL